MAVAANHKSRNSKRSGQPIECHLTDSSRPIAEESLVFLARKILPTSYTAETAILTTPTCSFRVQQPGSSLSIQVTQHQSPNISRYGIEERLAFHFSKMFCV
ncbi:hypothetical protein TNCV_2258001 [Trichonephila clavipes]|nr:hypothetical protein TNCV_2258001 [Trichonephila clavipes]